MAIDGRTEQQLGELRHTEAVARGEVPSAEHLLLKRAAQHARHEAAVREAARHGHALTGTSLLAHLEQNPVRPPVLPAPRRYNLLDRLGHICQWLLDDTPIPAQPRVPTVRSQPSGIPKAPIRT